MENLGETLKGFRISKQFTLRQVEEITGISNAYLSQLENSKIKNPSANILSKLAELYKIDINTLLQSKRTPSENKWLDRLTFYTSLLNDKENEKILEFARYVTWTKANIKPEEPKNGKP